MFYLNTDLVMVFHVYALGRQLLDRGHMECGENSLCFIDSSKQRKKPFFDDVCFCSTRNASYVTQHSFACCVTIQVMAVEDYDQHRKLCKKE